MNEDVVIPELWKKAFERGHVYKDEREQSIRQHFSLAAVELKQAAEFNEFFASEAGAALRRFMRETDRLQFQLWKGEDGRRGYLGVDGFRLEIPGGMRQISTLDALWKVQELGLVKEDMTFLEFFKKKISGHLQFWLQHGC